MWRVGEALRRGYMTFRWELVIFMLEFIDFVPARIICTSRELSSYSHR